MPAFMTAVTATLTV